VDDGQSRNASNVAGPKKPAGAQRESNIPPGERKENQFMARSIIDILVNFLAIYKRTPCSKFLKKTNAVETGETMGTREGGKASRKPERPQ